MMELKVQSYTGGFVEGNHNKSSVFWASHELEVYIILSVRGKLSDIVALLWLPSAIIWLPSASNICNTCSYKEPNKNKPVVYTKH